MFHEPFGPRGAEDERDTFWTDLGEVTDAAYRDEEPASPDTAKRSVGLQHAHGSADMLPGTVLPMTPGTPAAEEKASRQDPLGSWTGVPSDDAYETPTQDADDL